LYYAFDNRPASYRLAWRCSDLLRRGVHRLPPLLKHAVTDIIACVAYWPLARLSQLGALLGMDVSNIPLSYYRTHSFYTMRTDSRDRFGTPLEQRFSRVQIEIMMRDAGLSDVRFSECAPYWCAVGIKQ